MAMVRHLLPILACAAAMAQQPTPGAGGDGSIWSHREADALNHMQRLLDNARARQNGALPMPPGPLRVSDYGIQCFERDADSMCEPTQNGRVGAGLFLLAWPVTRTAATRRGIVMHADGTTLCCDLPEGDDLGLTADLVLGRGSAGRFEDVVRAPGTSATGHFWLWLDQVSTRIRVTVVDENGKARPKCRVYFVTPERGQGTALPEGPWPVAVETTTADGKAVLRGPRANGLLVQLMPYGVHSKVFDGFTCEPTGKELRIVIGETAIRSAGQRRNEEAAIATLKNISSAQAQCQATGAIDTDNDGLGEYGFFGELSGKCVVRGDDARKIQPPVLSSAFSRIQRARAERGGYLFQLWLPGDGGQAVSEAEQGGSDGRPVVADHAELRWCLYAWPTTAASGQRAFFVNQNGDVLAADNAGQKNAGLKYVGHDAPPAPAAAFAAGDGGLGATMAANAQGLDGQRWRVVM